MSRVAVVLLVLGMGFAGGRAAAQETDAHDVTIQVDLADDIDLGEPPAPITIGSGEVGTATSTLGVHTNAPPSDPRIVEAGLDSPLADGFVLEVDVVDDASVDGHVELSTDPQAVMTNLYSMSAPGNTLEYKVDVNPNVKTTEITVTVSYTVTTQ